MKKSSIEKNHKSYSGFWMASILVLTVPSVWIVYKLVLKQIFPMKILFKLEKQITHKK